MTDTPDQKPLAREWFALVAQKLDGPIKGLITRSFSSIEKAKNYCQEMGYDHSGTREIVHVIEYAAFERLQAELAEAKAERDELLALNSSVDQAIYALRKKECENLERQRDAALAEVERISKLYLELRDGHEHVNHIHHDEVQALTAQLTRAREALEELLEYHEDDCDFDHDGNCQSHACFGGDNTCAVADARQALEGLK